jgi:hypothetical protein
MIGADSVLASREKDFKLEFLRSRSGGGRDSASSEALPGLARWIDENLILEDRVLNRVSADPRMPGGATAF